MKKNEMTEKDKVYYEPYPCGEYIYKLWQKWGDEGRWCIFIMLNPSTKNNLENNPTIKNCKTIAKKEGCKGIILVDLFSRIAGDAKELMTKKGDIIGSPEHDMWLSRVLSKEDALIIVAWGERCKFRTDDFKTKVRFGHQIRHMKRMIKKHAVNAEIMQLEKVREEGMVSHPYWLAWLTKEKSEEEIRQEVLENYKLEPLF